MLALFNIGPMELLIMAAAAVMLFGGDLPATARKAARAVGRLRSLATDLGRELSAEEHLPPAGSLDMKRLINSDDERSSAAVPLPGRREDEPIGDNSAHAAMPEPTQLDADPDDSSSAGEEGDLNRP